MTIYRADPAASRLAVEAEDMTILYHRPSGTTHVLLSPAPEILDALAAGPADAGVLARRMDAEQTTEAVDIIDARLTELAAAGLVAVED